MNDEDRGTRSLPLAATPVTPAGRGLDTTQWTAGGAYRATIAGWTHPLPGPGLWEPAVQGR